jgi:hypothetical protein
MSQDPLNDLQRQRIRQLAEASFKTHFPNAQEDFGMGGVSSEVLDGLLGVISEKEDLTARELRDVVLPRLIRDAMPGLIGDTTVKHEHVLSRLELFVRELNEKVDEMFKYREGKEPPGEVGKVIPLFPRGVRK